MRIDPPAPASAGFDVASERRRYEHRLRHLAEHDALTGLYNRPRFESDLERHLAYARRYRRAGAVLVIELDNFKYVNEALGHRTGDDLIRGIGSLLVRRLRETDRLARLGGDEFAVLLAEVDAEGARRVALELLQAVRNYQPLLSGRPRRTTASIGVALFGTSDELGAEELLAAADAAMYEAKEAGRDRVVVHTDRRRVHGLTMTERIRHALDEDRFALHCQPIVDLRSGAIIECELLLRMIGDGGELIQPDAFLPTAARFGQMRAVDRWVVRNAVELIAAHRGELRLGVNLSAESIADSEMLGFVEGLLRDSGIDPRSLTFEITETAAIGSIEQAAGFARRLKELGCGFALDDFGTGFASFYYLKHLPFDYLKIAGDFVLALTSSATDQLVVRCVVEMARGLGKLTIAEKVENASTLELLRQLGVDYAQGFHLARPAPVSELLSTAALSASAARPASTQAA
jgi:diguanylate cyclase (GGDEF)-like protein